MNYRRFSAVILILAAMLLGACAEPARLFDSDSKSLAARDSTVLRIAAAPENEPFVYTDSDGRLLGFDSALGMLLAERMNMMAAFYPMSENSLLSALNCGIADVAISAIEPTDERRREAEFSESYITLTSSIVTNSGNTSVNNIDDLKTARNVGAVSGSYSCRYLTNELGLANMSEYRSGTELAGAMLRGDIDVMFADSAEAEVFVAEYPMFAIKQDGIDRHRFLIAAADGNSKLIREINDVLDNFRSDNTLLNLRRAYINGDADLRNEFDSRLESIH